MKLVEIFQQLTYGELSQISIGGGEAGEINASNYDRVISHINLGLTALYKRFPLKEGRITIARTPGRYTYPLTTAYAVSNVASTEPVKYIKDTVGNPFIGDILKIEGVYTKPAAIEDKQEFGLNDLANIYSISTPSASVLQIPVSIIDQTADLPEQFKTSDIEVVYRANHPIIKTDGSVDVDAYEVELPYSHLEPLLLFVASRVNNPIGMTPQTEFNAGNNYAAKYEQACQQLEVKNLVVDQGAQYDRIRRGGWV